MPGIHVVAVDEAGTLELVALATTLAGPATPSAPGTGEPAGVHLVRLGSAGALDLVAIEAAGATTLTVLAPAGAASEPVRPEAFVPALISLLTDAGTELVLVGAGVSGWEVAARIATGLGMGLVSEAAALRRVGDGWSADRVVFAGGAVQTETWRGPGVVSIVAGRHAADPAAVDVVPGALTTTTLSAEVDQRVRTLSRTARPVDAVDLAGAARVVCVGMGVGSRDDLALVAGLAEALGAELACTRPVAEDREWLPTSRYIGISGVTVHPDLYLGIGVSGQVQHTVGMREARVVVGIDTNPDAKLLAQSDVAVVADQREIVPLLVEALRARTGGQPTSEPGRAVPA